MKNNKKNISIILMLLLGTIVFSQRLYDSEKKEVTPIEDLKYLPSGKFLKGAALSFDEVVADLLWIKTIGYFADHYRTDKEYIWLEHILEITTDLDPQFIDPYEFGGVIFGYELERADKSIAIMKKGMENVSKQHKRYWYLPFYTAFNYMYYKEDYLTAAKYLEIAVSFPQSPPYLPLLVSRLYANSQDPGLALPFLQEMLASAGSPEKKAELDKRIKDITIKQHTTVLNLAINKYHKLTGVYPTDLKELVENNILKYLPVEPYGGDYKIMKNGTVQSTSDVDDMKLHLKKKVEDTKQPLIFLKEPK